MQQQMVAAMMQRTWPPVGDEAWGQQPWPPAAHLAASAPGNQQAPQLPALLPPTAAAVGQTSGAASQEPPAPIVQNDGPKFGDDDQRISTAYRVLGCSWKNGVRATVPKKLKGSVATYMDEEEWSMFRLSLLDDSETDMLLFILTGIPPVSRLSDLHIKTKGEFRRALSKEGKRVQKAQPERLSGLAHDLSNLETVAIKLGYDKAWLPKYRVPTPKDGPSFYHTPDARDMRGSDASSSTANNLVIAEPPSTAQLAKRPRLSAKTTPQIRQGETESNDKKSPRLSATIANQADDPPPTLTPGEEDEFSGERTQPEDENTLGDSLAKMDPEAKKQLMVLLRKDQARHEAATAELLGQLDGGKR